MELLKIEIPNFAREVQTSKTRRPKYYKKGENIPKKYQNVSYQYRAFGRDTVLFSIATALPIVKNPNKAGQPKYDTISGNDIWSEHKRGHYKAKFKATIQVYMWEVVKFLGKNDFIINETEYPLQINFDFYTYKEPQDLDNLDLWYRKCFLDAIQDQYNIDKGVKRELKEKRMIRNDNPLVIKQLNSGHHDCLKGQDSLIITISKSANKVIDYSIEEFLTINLTQL